MSFGGPIDAMINSHKDNKKLLKKKKSLKELQANYKAEKKPPLIFHEPSMHEKIRFRDRLAEDKSSDRMRFILIVGLTLIVILIILYWVVTADYSEAIDIVG